MKKKSTAFRIRMAVRYFEKALIKQFGGCKYLTVHDKWFFGTLNGRLDKLIMNPWAWRLLDGDPSCLEAVKERFPDIWDHPELQRSKILKKRNIEKAMVNTGLSEVNINKYFTDKGINQKTYNDINKKLLRKLKKKTPDIRGFILWVFTSDNEGNPWPISKIADALKISRPCAKELLNRVIKNYLPEELRLYKLAGGFHKYDAFNKVPIQETRYYSDEDGDEQKQYADGISTYENSKEYVREGRRKAREKQEAIDEEVS